MKRTSLFFSVICMVTLVFVRCNAETSHSISQLNQDGLYISEFMASNDSLEIGIEKKTYDWLEVFNSSDSDYILDELWVSDNPLKLKKTKLKGTLKSGEYKVLYAAGTDTISDYVDFKLNNLKGEIILSDKNGLIIDHVRYGKQVREHSQYRTGGSWYFTPHYTPGRKTHTDVNFTHLSQDLSAAYVLENDQIIVSLSSFSPSSPDLIYKILEKDSEPKEYKEYKGAFALKPGQVVKAKAVSPSTLEDKAFHWCFTPQADHSLPVVSLVSDPKSLWDEEKGIYTSENCGKRGDKWIKTGFINYYSEDSLIQNKVDFNIFGNASRSKPKKSISVKSKTELPNAFFSNCEQEFIDGFIMRASHTGMQMYRNEIINDVNAYLKGNLRMQEYTPAVLYLNGEYWGVYNIMERKNDEFIKNHSGFKATEMVNINDRQIKSEKGSFEDLEIALSKISLSENGEEIYTLLEETFLLDEFIDFWAHEFIVNRVDTYNNRFWKSTKSDDPKWGVISFDYDIVFGKADNSKLFDKYFFSEPDKGLTFFNAAMKSHKFKQKLVFRICEFLNFGYTAHVTDQLIIDYSSKVSQEFLSDTARWQKVNAKKFFRDEDSAIRMLRSYIQKRTAYIHDDIFPKIGFSERVVFRIPDDLPGKVVINGFEVRGEAIFYAGVTLSVEFIPNSGVTFEGWTNGSETLDLGESYLFKEAITLSPLLSQ